MADRPYSSGARDLDFISSNPSTDAFQHGQKIARDQEAQDIINEGRMVENAVSKASAPTRLRTLVAHGDSARAKADVDVATVPYQVRQSYDTTRTGSATADVAEGTIGSRISQSRSAASLAGTQANVARETAPYTVDNAYQGNRVARSNADVTVETQPDRIKQTRDATRTGTAGADVAVATVPDKIMQSRDATRLGTVTADIGEATKPDRIRQQGPIATRQAEATAANAELAAIYKLNDALQAGDIDGALAIAAASGKEIPAEALAHADTRKAINDAVTVAKTTYANRPKDAIAYIQGYIQDIARRREEGQRASDPAAPYNVPGAPTPEEDTTRSYFEWVEGNGPDPNDPTKQVPGTWKVDRYAGTEEFTPGQSISSRSARAGSGGHTSVFQQRQQAYLAVHPGDQQGALDYASGKKQLGDSELTLAAMRLATTEINSNTMLKFKDQTQRSAAVQKRAGEILQTLRNGFGQPNGGGPTPPGSPQPAPAPAAPRPSVQLPPGLSGNGSQQAPFQATDQAHVEWFKTTAPAGAVILINGQLFTK